MVHFIKKNFSTLISIFLICFVVVRMGPSWINSYKQKGTDFTKLTVVNLKGNPVAVPFLNKKAVYIFWTTWCEPCHFQLSLFKKAVASGELNAEQIVAVNLGEPLDSVLSFQQKQKYPFKMLKAPAQFSWEKFHVMVTPTIAYVSKEGKVEDFSSGLSPLAVFRSKSFLN